jgi:outer membrane protein OmpA-like peptidoglycan-associated protein
MALSRDRANAVVIFIATRHGIDRKRFVPVGKGSTETMPNLDARDPKNRRVVFKVVTG